MLPQKKMHYARETVGKKKQRGSQEFILSNPKQRGSQEFILSNPF